MSAMPPNNNPFLNTGSTPPAKPAPTTAPATPSANAPAAAPTFPQPPRIVTGLPRRPGAKKPSDEPSTLTAIKDTIEAIIIALILALTFRAFMVEAFVIPTASMGPTLLGAHYHVICPQCGYEFDESADVNRQWGSDKVIHPLAEGELSDNTALPAEDYRTCPNCGYHIKADQLPEKTTGAQFVREVRPLRSDRSTTEVARDMFFPWADNGDRILVMKYRYAIAEPKRWDVIVFKEPEKGVLNYIKRLAGLPNETIEIIGGDLYAGPASTADVTPVLHLQRKPQDVQKGMWQLVYDNDFYPIDAGKARTYTVKTGPDDEAKPIAGDTWTNPWTASARDQASWDISGPVLSYAGTAPSAVNFKQREFYLYNVSGYDAQDFNRLPEAYELYMEPRSNTPNVRWHKFVGDLHLETLWTPDAGQPMAVKITLGLPFNCFRASITSDGSGSVAQLERFDDASQKFVAMPSNTPGLTFPSSTMLVAGHPTPVVMENVDHAVHFFVNGQELIHYEPEWTDKDGHQWVTQLGEGTTPPRVSIEVGGRCTLGHVKLMRDVYYTNTPGPRSSSGRGTDGNPVTLLSDEFFALGDNSNYSWDSRFWGQADPRLWDLPGFNVEGNEHAGRVPRRYLLGKAFFVYWPAGFRPMESVPIPLVPDAGHMRIIR